MRLRSEKPDGWLIRRLAERDYFSHLTGPRQAAWERERPYAQTFISMRAAEVVAELLTREHGLVLEDKATGLPASAPAAPASFLEE